MALPQDNISMALFCDFENVALGVRDANYDKFDIKRVLERLLLKGSIVVKKAYCDWDRYRQFKAPMHEANFELIEIPHVRQSGKNSADIRMVVDALDLCYTKAHVNTFVIISGDSDFSPLVSKLRENAKFVIGVGVKQSTSDLLIANCDEFIFYDDLVRESQRQAARQGNRDQPQPRRSPEEDKRRREEMDARRTKAVEMAAETYEALVTDRDEGGRVWASVLKEAIKRRNPGFNENYYGFRTFGNLLEDAQQRGLLDFGRDEKSGAYVSRGTGIARRAEAPAALPMDDGMTAMADMPLAGEGQGFADGDAAGHEPAHADANGRAAQAGRDAGRDANRDANREPGRGQRGRRGGRSERGGERGGDRGAERGAERHAERGRGADRADGGQRAPLRDGAPDRAPAVEQVFAATQAPADQGHTDQAESRPEGRKPAGKTASKTPRKTARGKTAVVSEGAAPEASAAKPAPAPSRPKAASPQPAPDTGASAATPPSDTPPAAAKKAASRPRRTSASSGAGKPAAKKKAEAA